MKEEIKVLELDKYELGILINALNEFSVKTYKFIEDYNEIYDEYCFLNVFIFSLTASLG